MGFKAEEYQEGAVAFEKQKTKTEKEIKNLRNKFVISLLLGLSLMYLSMGGMLGLSQPNISIRINVLIQFLIATFIMFLNANIYVSGLKKLVQRNPNMDTLVETGTLAAYFYSIALALYIWFNPS